MMVSADVNLIQWSMGSGIVILLLITFALGVRLLKHGHLPNSKSRRLKMVESLPLSAKHRVVILEDGAQEHVILLGPTQDLHLRQTPLKKSPQSKKKVS